MIYPEDAFKALVIIHELEDELESQVRCRISGQSLRRGNGAALRSKLISLSSYV
jgi:hypothetical protein